MQHVAHEFAREAARSKQLKFVRGGAITVTKASKKVEDVFEKILDGLALDAALLQCCIECQLAQHSNRDGNRLLAFTVQRDRCHGKKRKTSADPE